jgi:multicomponent Na+:H+ antiporter subunit B
MNSIIFQVIARLLVPIMFLFSLFLTLRGHNDAGGGFIGGLIGGGALIIYALAFSPPATLRMLPLDPEKLIACGLSLSVVSTFFGVLNDKPLMTSVWFDRIGLEGIGTPALFDFGVYFVVIGIALKILLPLIEDTK